MRLSRKLCVAGAGLSLLAACASPKGSASDEAPELGVEVVSEAGAEVTGKPRFGSFGFDAEGMGAGVAPGDDFYAYASGAWQESTEIPADRSRYGVFDMLSLEAEEKVNQIIVAAARAGGEPGSNTRLIGELYASWMDAESIEARGLKPLAPYLSRIQALGSHAEVASLMAELPYQHLVRMRIMPDPANPSVYAVSVGQSGLGLPNRDYYLDTSERFEQYRQAYVAYIATVFELAGFDDGESRAQAILELETAIARAHWTRERSRQVEETYNVLTLEAFNALAPQLLLARGLEIRGLGGVDKVIVSQPSALEGIGQAFEGASLDRLKDYLIFHFISDRASWLPQAFDQASFEFYSQTLRGTQEQRPRDRRGTELVGWALGHAVGQEYVAQHFSPASKAQMDALVAHLIEGFRGRLQTLEWMDDATRAQALEKLSSFEPRIGYPEKWDSYEGLQLQADDYFGNRMRLSEHRWARELERFEEGVDRERWSWPPQIVNASYNPLMNQITFPAGILQAPFFDPHADPAMNYGAIGAVIGHEIGHGFDDQGRRFDAQGHIRDWWTPQTNAAFEEASGRLAEQYSSFCPIDDLCVNGRLSMGENIGDLGGMQMAYAAWRTFVKETYPEGEAPVIDGFTGDQRFFLAWAQVWRSLYRDDALRAQLVNGPHSPGMYRVNGVVRNLDAWYEAFDVTEDHALYLPPEERVRIW
ncbi:M13 family peptidase [Lujinxingia litoralis]|uniref:M13 family peptidase n=1 Tax=Lujinxingia litoralis TaxID=2211119 RepID=A0A328CBV2_9DELT|nr:M13 family metallopeptidase [Lujinxingia litoralis]RAL25364.1 M13 family peptidase [Lujinxingia litoralis]